MLRAFIPLRPTLVKSSSIRSFTTSQKSRLLSTMADVEALRASIPSIATAIRELKAQKADEALIKEQQLKLADVNKTIAALTASSGKSEGGKHGRLTLKTPKVRCRCLLLYRRRSVSLNCVCMIIGYPRLDPSRDGHTRTHLQYSNTRLQSSRRLYHRHTRIRITRNPGWEIWRR